MRVVLHSHSIDIRVLERTIAQLTAAGSDRDAVAINGLVVLVLPVREVCSDDLTRLGGLEHERQARGPRDGSRSHLRQANATRFSEGPRPSHRFDWSGVSQIGRVTTFCNNSSGARLRTRVGVFDICQGAPTVPEKQLGTQRVILSRLRGSIPFRIYHHSAPL